MDAFFFANFPWTQPEEFKWLDPDHEASVEKSEPKL